MPELHLRQPEFTYSACGQFTKHLDRIQSFERAYEIARFSQYVLHKYFDKKARSGVNVKEVLAPKFIK